MYSLIHNYINFVAQTTYTTDLPHTGNGDLKTILSILIGIVGALSVLFVIIGGLRYILSAGNPQEASRAKETIIFALVGLVISITAEAIVAFALSTVAGNQ
jgi:hypothetical protein